MTASSVTNYNNVTILDVMRVRPDDYRLPAETCSVVYITKSSYLSTSEF